jgi:L-alanine-DL-glutamate epimerase-like enolase superfamily enzyme
MEHAGRDRVERIELHHIEVPLPSPLFPTWIPGHAVSKLNSTLLVVKTREGLVGHATGPAFERERSGLGDFIGPFLMGMDPFDVDGARERLRQASYLGWRNNWMDVAFWDLAAQERGLPVHRLLAERLGAAKDVPPPDSIRSFASFQELRPEPARAEVIERALRVGFRGVKIGVHDAEERDDLAHLDLARREAGPQTELFVHCHQAWSVSLVRSVPRWDFERARRFVHRASELGYERVQEPLHEEDWEGMERLREEADVPLAGGDLVVSVSQLRNLARDRCYDILTPASSFAGLGRLEVAMQMALRHGLDFSPMSYWDGMEVAAHLHALAAWARVQPRAKPRLAFPWEPPAQMPEYRDALLRRPLQVDDQGCLPVPRAPGLGVEIDPSALKRFGHCFYELTPVRLMASSVRRSGLRQTKQIAGRDQDKRRYSR